MLRITRNHLAPIIPKERRGHEKFFSGMHPKPHTPGPHALPSHSAHQGEEVREKQSLGAAPGRPNGPGQVSIIFLFIFLERLKVFWTNAEKTMRTATDQICIPIFNIAPSTVAPPPPRPVGGGGAPLSPLKKFLKVLRFFRGLTFRARAFSKCVSFCSDSRCEMLHLLRFRNLPNRVLFWSRLTTWVTNSAHFFGHGKKAGFEINFQECLWCLK